MPKKYAVELTGPQHAQLYRLIACGAAPARQLAHARVLLKSDAGTQDALVAAALELSASTVQRVRQRFAQHGLDAALTHKRPARLKPPRLDGRAEARLIALACSEPPEGRARWTLRLLAGRLVELDVVGGVSPETVRRTLRRNELKPHLRRSWCIPPGASGAFVCAMEDVLDLYERPYDPRRPVVCFDEKPVQLLTDARDGLAAAPGRPERVDYEYRRQGGANVFGYLEPLAGWRAMEVTARRTKQDFARCMKRLADEFYPDAEAIEVVLDNLSTHTKGALYDTFFRE